MPKSRRFGSRRVRGEFVQAHCQHLHEWYDSRGRFMYSGNRPSSRHRLWDCCSLLRRATRPDLSLAEAIIMATPVDDFSFEPVAALDLLLAFPDRLARPTQSHLQRMCQSDLPVVIEHRFAGAGNNNFTCMHSYFLACAGQVLKGYRFEVKHHLIPEVYTSGRLNQIGLNALLLVQSYAERNSVFAEWNSPTYSALSLMALAKTLRDGANPGIRRIALDAQITLWRELLALYHPKLNVACGPYSRAYRVDILGQVSLMRALLCYVGLSRDHSLVSLLDEKQPGVHFHHGCDMPFNWANIAWLLSCDYHLPTDVVTELRQRTFPRRFTAPIAWPAHGFVDKKKKCYVQVQGSAFPAGLGHLVQVQHGRWALGYRTVSTYGHSFPIHLHYAVAARLGPMQNVRNVTVGVGLLAKPDEWITGSDGRRTEADNFNHGFALAVKQRSGGLSFRGQVMNNLAALPTAEISFNSFIPLHFGAVDLVMLNGNVWQSEQRLDIQTKRAVCRISDHGCEYEIVYESELPVVLALYRWANFLRFAALFYEGPVRAFPVRELGGFRVRGSLRLLHMPRD